MASARIFAAYGGSLISESISSRWVYVSEHYLTEEVIASCYAVARRHDLQFWGFGISDWWVLSPSKEADLEAELTGREYLVCPPPHPRLCKALLVGAGPVPDRALSDISTTCRPARALRSKANYVEIVPHDAADTKGLGAIVLKLGFDSTRTAAVGDGENDASMIRAAAYRYALPPLAYVDEFTRYEVPGLSPFDFIRGDLLRRSTK